MDEIQIGQWCITYDRGATIRSYQRVPRGGAEECRCQSCRNFIAARYRMYSRATLDILHALGIDPEKEAEAVDYGTNPDDPHLHLGNSWFHVVGCVIEGPTEPETSFVAPDEKTGVTFTRRLSLVPVQFEGASIVQVEWFGNIPWVLDEPRKSPYD